MAALPAPETQEQPAGQRKVTALDTVLAAGTVAAATLAPVAIPVATEAGTLAAIGKAAEALAISSSDAADRAGQLVLDSLPSDPEARAIDTALMRKRSRQFKVESVKRVLRGAREALREPTKKQVVSKLATKIRATPPDDKRKLRALSTALAEARKAPSPRMAKMRSVIEKEGRYAAQHAEAQIGRANGAATQATLAVISPAGAIWRTRHDDRVTADCAMLDGKALPHSVLRVHHPPNPHVGCRCYLTPIPGDGDALSHAEASGLVKRAMRLHEEDHEVALTEELLDRLGPAPLTEEFDPSLHPRGPGGLFVPLPSARDLPERQKRAVEKWQEVGAFIPDATKRHLRKILDGLPPSSHEVTVHRSGLGDGLRVEDGKLIADRVVSTHLGPGEGGGERHVIRLPAGTRALWLGDLSRTYQHEREVLLPPGEYPLEN